MAGHPLASTVLPTVRRFAWEGHQIAKFCWVQCGIGSQGSFDIDNNDRTPQADISTAQTALRPRCYTDRRALADLAQASRPSVHPTNRLAMLLRGGHHPPLVVCDLAHGKEEDGRLEPRTRLHQADELHGCQLASSAAEAKVPRGSLGRIRDDRQDAIRWKHADGNGTAKGGTSPAARCGQDRTADDASYAAVVSTISAHANADVPPTAAGSTDDDEFQQHVPKLQLY